MLTSERCFVQADKKGICCVWQTRLADIGHGGALCHSELDFAMAVCDMAICEDRYKQPAVLTSSCHIVPGSLRFEGEVCCLDQPRPHWPLCTLRPARCSLCAGNGPRSYETRVGSHDCCGHSAVHGWGSATRKRPSRRTCQPLRACSSCPVAGSPRLVEPRISRGVSTP